MIALLKAIRNKRFLKVWKVRGTVKNSDFFLSFRDLLVEDFKAFRIAVGDNDAVAKYIGRGLIAESERGEEFFFKAVGIFLNDAEEQLKSAGRLGMRLERGFERSFEEGADEGFVFSFLQVLELDKGEIGVDKIFRFVVNSVSLVSELQKFGGLCVNVAEKGKGGFFLRLCRRGWGGIFLCLGQDLTDIFLPDIFAADHFEKNDGIGGELLIKLFVISEICDVDGSDEVNLNLIFFISGDGSLQVKTILVFMRTNEVGRLGFHGGHFGIRAREQWDFFFLRGEEGEESEKKK